MKMVPVLLGWYLYNLTESKLVLGFVGLSEVIPAILLALPAGVKVYSSDNQELNFLYYCDNRFDYHYFGII